jgi:hypothetical protein
VDVKQVGRELGVRYVLEGSVRKAGNRIRIAGQLIDAETGAHLWADRFDGALEDIFDLQDQVTSSVVGAIAPMLQREEIKRARRKPTEILGAYDYYLRGFPCSDRPRSSRPSWRRKAAGGPDLHRRAQRQRPQRSEGWREPAILLRDVKRPLGRDGK